MRVSLSVRTSDGSIAKPAWEIFANATPGKWKLLELGFTLAAATASTFGLNRPAAIGVTPTSPVDFLPDDTGGVLASGLIRSAVAWGTEPTEPTLGYIRRASFPATIGTGIVWTFPEGIYITVEKSLVLWNITENAVVDAWATLEI